MFEKEAEEYRESVSGVLGIASWYDWNEMEHAYMAGAEFGYNKGYHNAEEHYMSVIDDQHKLVEENKTKVLEILDKLYLSGLSEKQIAVIEQIQDLCEGR